MKKTVVVIIIIIILAALAGAGYFFAGNRQKTATYSQAPAAYDFKATTTPMTITSPAFEEGQTIPKKYTCESEGMNPPLNFGQVSEKTASLALIADDPDAAGGDWVHWLVWNINPNTPGIAEGSVPAEATEGTTSFGRTGYGSPCPPSGLPHHYHFKLYALDTKLSLPMRTAKADLEAAMNGHILDQVELIGVYQR